MTAFEFRAVVAVVAVGYVLISLAVVVWVLFVQLNETYVEKQQWMWKYGHTKEAMQVDLRQAQYERNHLRVMVTRMADDLVLANARAARWQEIAMRKGMQLTEEVVYHKLVQSCDRIIAGK